MTCEICGREECRAASFSGHFNENRVGCLSRGYEREKARADAAEAELVVWRDEDGREAKYEHVSQRCTKAEEALAAARREVERLRAVAEATLMFHGARVWDDEASEAWHRLTGQPSTTKGLCDFARAALAAPADGEEGK